MIRRWYLWLPLAAFIAFIILVTSGLMRPMDRDVVSRMVGKPVPEFALKPSVPEHARSFKYGPQGR